MQLAFHELLRTTAAPNRFADAAQRAALSGVLGQELVPTRDDPCRIAPEPSHVHEPDLAGRAAERVTQPRGVLA